MNTQKPNSPKKRPDASAGKYLSMATYMAVVITVGTLGGRWIDQHFHFVKFPVFTLTFSLLSVFWAMWYFIRDSIKK